MDDIFTKYRNYTDDELIQHARSIQHLRPLAAELLIRVIKLQDNNSSLSKTIEDLTEDLEDAHHPNY